MTNYEQSVHGVALSQEDIMLNVKNQKKMTNGVIDV